MTDHVHAPVRTYPFAHRLKRRRVIKQRNIVHGHTMRGEVVAMTVAHTEIQRPDIREPVIQKIGNQVVVLRHDEHVGRGREPVHDHHDVVTIGAFEPFETQTQFVFGVEADSLVRGILHAFERVQRNLAFTMVLAACVFLDEDRRLLPERFAHAVDFPQRPKEQPRKFFPCLVAFSCRRALGAKRG